MTRFVRIWLLVAILLFAAVATPAQAQTGGRIVLRSPDITKFPTVGLTFEAYDAQNNFLNDLSQGELQVTENGQPVTVDSLSQIQPGMHIILAFNTAPSMGLGLVNGPTRFDQVRSAALNWVQSRPAKSPDVLSLVTNTGPQATRVTDPKQLTDAFTAYTPDLAKTQSSLSSLTTALDLASDPSRVPDTRRAILYITSPLPDTALVGLPNLAERASQLGVRISTWLVLGNTKDERSTKPLADFSERTGGQFLTFSGVESLPNPEVYFLPLRYLYRLNFTSLARQNGIQRVSLAIRRPGFSTPVEQRYTLNLQPPNPFFLSPPSHLKRTWSPAGTSDKPTLTPDQVEVQAIVEFPDGLRREIKASRLFVDGQLAYEATAEPFNPLVWSLTGYTSSGRHTLKVEMEDVLGLSHSSIEIPVDVEVEAAPVFRLDVLISQARPYLPYVGYGAAGLLVIVLGWFGFRALRGIQIKRPAVAQPKPAPRRRAEAPAPARLLPSENPDAPARLRRVPDGSNLQPGGFIALTQAEIRLGRDPQKVDFVLDSAAVESLHARIQCMTDGRYIISDAGSIAGTWVNYLPIPPEGRALEHGDLVQLGRETFRFELKDPPAPRQPRITLIHEER